MFEFFSPSGIHTILVYRSYTDTKHRAASLRQQSFLCYFAVAYVVYIFSLCCFCYLCQGGYVFAIICFGWLVCLWAGILAKL